jgi:hypothetical protein
MGQRGLPQSVPAIGGDSDSADALNEGRSFRFLWRKSVHRRGREQADRLSLLRVSYDEARPGTFAG